MTFKDDSPGTPHEYLNMGCDITPCIDKRPILADWQNKKTKEEDWIITRGEVQKNIGLKMTGLKDIDCDNHYVKRFAGKYLLSPSSSFGRRSNPCSHYIYSGETKSKKFVMPKELESYCKDFPHGVTLLEVRSGSSHQTIAPGSRINNENVEWNHWIGFQEYVVKFDRDVGKIALSVALTIIYPPKGNRDNFCTAIAGVLSNHTNWTANEIDVFVYNLASLSGKDENANKKMAKGTNAKNDKTKNFGLPKLAEVVGCSISTLAKLFEWIGVKNSSSLFSELKVYETDPTMWKIKYKNTWITIMDSSHLLSWTKMSIHILENCYEVPNPMKPAEWKATINNLLSSVQKIKVDESESYFGQIGAVIDEFLNRDDRFNPESYNEKKALKSSWGVYVDFENNIMYFRLESLVMKINDARLKYEQRKLTQFIRDQYKAVPTKLNVEGKDVRCWKAPVDIIRGRNNKSGRTNNSWQNYEHNGDSDTLKRDSETEHIKFLAFKKKQRQQKEKRDQEKQDEEMRKLQLEHTKDLDNY